MPPIVAQLEKNLNFLLLCNLEMMVHYFLKSRKSNDDT